MSDYKVIKGLKVPSVASDPSPATAGQMWYDTATEDLKYTTVAGAWSAGGTLNTGRNESAVAGIQTAALIFGGTTPAKTTNTESYDGSTWTEVNNLTLATSSMSRAGTQTAALCVGGNHFGISAVESWDGTSWTDNAASMNTTRSHAGGGGVQTAALAYGGQQTTMTSNSETWNGTSWTEGNNLNTTLSLACTDGTVTSAMACGGKRASSVSTVNTETYDGTCWSENGGDLNRGREVSGGSGTAAIFLAQAGQYPAGAGGHTPPANPYTALTEQWDGTSWAAQAELANARALFNAGSGTTTASIVASGSTYPNSYSSFTEEWSVAPTTKTVTVS